MIRPRPEAGRNCLERAAVCVRGDERGMGVPSPGRTPEDAAPLRHRRDRAFLGIVLIDLAMLHVHRYGAGWMVPRGGAGVCPGFATALSGIRAGYLPVRPGSGRRGSRGGFSGDAPGKESRAVTDPLRKVGWSSPLSLAGKHPIIAWLNGDRQLRRHAPGASEARNRPGRPGARQGYIGPPVGSRSSTGRSS
jgi:hypothetical protein